jgi:Nif-specific regulatory protein
MKGQIATLVALSGPSEGAALRLDRTETSIGRDRRNRLVLADASVSPRHCVIVCQRGQVTIRDLDPANQSFINGLPATTGRALSAIDRIRIGNSTLGLTFTPVEPSERVRVTEQASGLRSLLVMRREDVFSSNSPPGSVASARPERDLAGLMRATAAISAVRGLVGLERPLIDLIADVVPLDRGAVILLRDREREVVAAVGTHARSGGARSLRVNRTVIDRVLNEGAGVVGVLRTGGTATTSVLAAPLVAFDHVLGAIYLESDSPDEPFDENRLRLVMSIAAVAATALGYAQHAEALADENRRLQAELEVDHRIVGDSPAMRALFRRIGRVAPSDSTVLITGESGTGKELVARAIHGNSPRADRPFVAINCAAITETLLESELFGYEKGAFTGAVTQRKGKLEAADGGTVLLDEVGELSPALQAKLLRVLQEREFDRVGGTRPIAVDFRLLAATNRDLEQAIAAGTFRRDLYYRLNVVSLSVPPLRERREDVPLLVNDFIRRHAKQAKRRLTGVSDEALACLVSHDWPGNVRELENAIERALVLGTTPLIVPEDLPDAVAAHGATAARTLLRPGKVQFRAGIAQAKKNLIVDAFTTAGGSYTSAARLLGLHPNYLHRLIRHLNLKPALKEPS